MSVGIGVIPIDIGLISIDFGVMQTAKKNGLSAHVPLFRPIDTWFDVIARHKILDRTFRLRFEPLFFSSGQVL